MALATALSHDMATVDKAFRFMDLPGELRNKVYGLLLCSFEPRPYNGSPVEACSVSGPFIRAKHSIKTAILLANSQIHREAYDVMVKTNRFVLLRSTSDLPLEPIIKVHGIPVVTTDAGKVSKFRGYVLELRLSAKRKLMKADDNEISYPIGPMCAMILARDLDLVCDSMTKVEGNYPNFPTSVSLRLYMAPVLDRNLRYQDNITDFFSEATQKALLKPFRTFLRSFSDVEVRGHVLPDLARVTKAEVKANEWDDPVTALESLRVMKHSGLLEFQKGEHCRAYKVWTCTIFEISRMRRGSSWSFLVARAGELFIQEVAELLFKLCLNAIHAVLSDRSTQEMLDALVERPIDFAEKTMEPNYWNEGYTYKPPVKLLAKLRYRQAVILRRGGSIQDTPVALTAIEHAVHLLPLDPMIKEEEKRIDKWARTFDM